MAQIKRVGSPCIAMLSELQSDAVSNSNGREKLMTDPRICDSSGNEVPLMMQKFGVSSESRRHFISELQLLIKRDRMHFCSL